MKNLYKFKVKDSNYYWLWHTKVPIITWLLNIIKPKIYIHTNVIFYNLETLQVVTHTKK